MLFTKIKNFIIEHKKIMLFLCFLILFLSPDFAFAAEDKGDWEILKIINWVITYWAMMIWVATQFSGMFLTPEWSSGSAIWFWEHLRSLWIMVSSIVYFIFAFILIWIAFMNILWKWGDWELKQALPKFIWWVIIVPFTWLIVAWMISLSNILAISILTIPYDTFWDKLPTSLGLDKDIICTTYEIASKEKGASPIRCKWWKTSIKKLIEKGDGYFGIFTVYTYNIMKVKDNWEFNLWDLNKWINSWSDLIGKALFDIIFFIIFLILIIAICLALFIRWIRLWFFTILSPIFWLLFFFWSDKVWDLKKFSIQEFISLALVPVYVSAALAFWLLFIHVAWEWMNEACKNSKENMAVCIQEKDGVSQMEFLWVKFEFHWTTWSSWVDNWGKTFKWVFWDFVLKVFWLVFLWIAVMAALERSSLTQAVVAPIKSFWESVWKLAQSAPTYAPIIPSPNGGMMSASAMGTMWSTLQTNINSKFTSRWNDIANKLFNTEPIIKAINDQTLHIDKNRLKTDKNYKDSEVIKAISRISKEDWNDSNIREHTLKLLGGLWIDADKLKKVTNYSTAQSQLPKILKKEIGTWTTELQYKSYIEKEINTPNINWNTDNSTKTIKIDMKGENFNELYKSKLVDDDKIKEVAKTYKNIKIEWWTETEKIDKIVKEIIKFNWTNINKDIVEKLAKEIIELQKK